MARLCLLYVLCQCNKTEINKGKACGRAQKFERTIPDSNARISIALVIFILSIYYVEQLLNKKEKNLPENLW